MVTWCGGKSVDAEPAGKSVTTKELLGLRAVVHPDGNDANLTFHTTAGEIHVFAPLEQVAAAQTEIRSAALIMQYRQSMKIDEGENAFDDLLRAALRPVALTVLTDSSTGDRRLAMQFADRLPIVIQMTAQQVFDVLTEFCAEAQRTAN